MTTNTRQHTATESILLHLIPGAILVACIFAFSNRNLTEILGVDERLAPVVGYLCAILTGLMPVQLGIILLAGKQETGKFSIRETIRFTEKNPLKDYLWIVPALILYSLVLFVFVSPLIQPYITKRFFSWYPEQFNFQLLLQDPAKIAGYQGIKLLVPLYILLSGILGPFVEELYFRGYLLPRMQGFSGKWVPVWNTVLFSLYHFFSPWENLVRILAGIPLVYTVWKKQDIRFGILVHVLINTIGGIGMAILVF